MRERMNTNTFIVKGDICWSRTKDEICTVKNGYVVCEDHSCAGVYERLPQQYADVPCYDYTGKLVIPGLVDLHLHAPQYAFRGLGMDLELIDWLNTHAFIQESKYADIAYADKAYDIFVEDLKKSATTRTCMFATMHNEATLLLMEKLESEGMSAYVGKVNMDRNSPEYLCEKDAKQAAEDTEKWILASKNYNHVKPILTPRFTPSCTDELFKRLAELQKKYHLPMQSHLSENLKEIEWVKELCPNTNCYGESYDQYGLFGGTCPTIMAHSVYSSEDEIELMRRNRVFIAHCPESNANLSSGIAPIRKYLNHGIRVGLGSDIAGGTSLSIFKSMSMAIQCSKLRWRLCDQTLAPLTVEEVFYLATKGGGEFFGRVGSFEENYEFDAVVLDDTALKHPQELTVRERLERMIYLAEQEHVVAKFINGRAL